VTFTKRPAKTLLASIAVLLASLNCLADNTNEPIYFQYQIEKRLPHDPALFTQGLVIHQQRLYESAGNYGQSQLLIRHPDSIKPLYQHRLSDNYFAEGIAILGSKLYQLSWRSQTGFIYRADDLTTLSTFRYAGEGWGLTSDGKQLIISDGSDYLRFLSPETFKELKRIRVTLDGRPIRNINELEWVNGQIAANIWHADHIVFINPATGKVTGFLDLSTLRQQLSTPQRAGVLNGIAYSASRNQLYITGKNWSELFVLRLSPNI
jgi:glutamine cyclotransferase